MALLDQVKQALRGRSATIEKGIDAVVGRLGQAAGALEAQAQGLKARVRALDDDAGPPGASPSTTTAPTTTGPQALRGDLAPPTPPVPPAAGRGQVPPPPPTV